MDKAIDFEWYKVFYEVAHRGSVSGAAADLAVSQPAVSQSIRNLEQAFGTRLFHRRSRGVELTETGRKLYSYVRESYRLLKMGERAVLELLDLSAVSLLIGAPEDLGTYLLTPLFQQFRQRHPAVVLQTKILNNDDVVRGVTEGALEAGFVSLPVETGPLEVLEFMQVEDVFIAGPEFAGLQGKKIGVDEIMKLPMAAPSEKSSSRRILNNFLNVSHEWAPVYETDGVEGIRRFAAAGLGIGFLPREVLQGSPREDGLFALNVEKELTPRNVCFIYRRDIPSASGVELMLDLIRAHEAQL
ncbi:LysR family transcriptional regulator [Marispirochaeta sp.]|jgi:DNA-binding transcriptional LysR family regulator|uniref:LysR family transcriptional regulator n=1 Tax=Marispirochaeta sp. TaxID=2038653 RepID=UPI0029C60BB9|nr:LysR family transcriptional regulator [Marispirochaeta sp.]